MCLLPVYLRWLTESVSQRYIVQSVCYLAAASPLFYAVGCSSAMFANEHEERTYNWLRALPLTPRQLFIAKFTAALLTTIAMALVLARIIHEFDRVRRKPFVRNELRLSYRKYSPKVWDCNASHAKIPGECCNSNQSLHRFGEYLHLTYFTLRHSNTSPTSPLNLGSTVFSRVASAKSSLHFRLVYFRQPEF